MAVVGACVLDSSLCLGIDAGLAGFDYSEKAFFDLRFDFGEHGIALTSRDLASIDPKIQRISNFQKAQRGEEDGLRWRFASFLACIEVPSVVR